MWDSYDTILTKRKTARNDAKVDSKIRSFVVRIVFGKNKRILRTFLGGDRGSAGCCVFKTTNDTEVSRGI